LPLTIAAPIAACRAADSWIMVTSCGAGQFFTPALTTASW
jgi:hypothetical protein